MATFGERFKQLRLQRGLTQDKLASSFSLNKSSISRYEKDSQVPENPALQGFADLFEVSMDYLLGRSDVRNVGPENQYEPILTQKNERDIGKLLNKTLEMIKSQDAIMLDGDILDEEDLEILAKSIKAGLEYAKISNKKKYTPKKYRNSK
ncbi:helix-turn-helix domain-containing protein [Clostridium lacusfryxellense]|uniref:helix-turn-helix domain-containing protein n=1 Tax=Clostridium lacusfryxellense TaxID=205328 RepID=UPI001C0C03CF|nr:helix-turn-helix transcriptional regulator [Clostridium lacusfryxellense]MBU3111003.1 helix-turn-helix domain-containing protein [Clostridium lacusfryxellense]